MAWPLRRSFHNFHSGCNVSRRALAYCCLLVAILGGIFLALKVVASGGSVNQANVQRIKKGMSKSEVEALLGLPQRYQKCEAKFWDTGETATEAGQWQEDGYAIEVYFDAGARVVRRQGMTVASDNVFVRFRRWLGITSGPGVVTD